MEEQNNSIFPELKITYATFGQRLGALIIDIIVCEVAEGIFQKISGVKNVFEYILLRQDIPASSITFAISTTIVDWLYFSLMESGRKQATLGKMAVGIKVTDLSGNRISFSKATARYFAKIISGIILLIGYFMMLWDDRNQTLHDKIAGTLVVTKLAYI